MPPNLASLVRYILLTESSPAFVQTVNKKPSIKYDKIPGIQSIESRLSATQRQNLRGLLEFRPIEDLNRYDQEILSGCTSANVNPALFKALGLMESQLGKLMSSGGSSARGFIHMTRSTYLPYADKVGVREQDMDKLMLDPAGSIPVCALHLRYLVDKFHTPERVAYSVKNGEYKISKLTAGMKGSAADQKVSSEISDSDYTQICLALRQLFSTSGPLQVGIDL